MKLGVALTSAVATVAFVAQIASASVCNRATVYRGIIDQVGHSSLPVGSMHTLHTLDGRSVLVTIQYRSAISGWQLPDWAMTRLGFSSGVSQGTVCQN